MLFPRILAVAVLSILMPITAAAEISNDDLSLNPKQQTAQIAALIDDVFTDEEGFTAADRKTIKKMADCESGGQTKRGGPNGLIMHLQPDGRLTTNKKYGADGAMQIASKLHSRGFRSSLHNKGVHEHDIMGNLIYARALMQERIEKEGYARRFHDWLASKSCWSKVVVANNY